MSNVINLFQDRGPNPKYAPKSAANAYASRPRQNRRSRYELKEQDKNYVTSGCRWYSRLQVYKGKHFYFDPKELSATSYNWYPMLMKIGRRLVLNECHYSNQTVKDFSKLHACMSRENIKEDCSVYAPQGLHKLDASQTYYEYEIRSRLELMAKPKTWKRKNLERKQEIKQLKKKLILVKSLIKAQRKAA